MNEIAVAIVIGAFIIASSIGYNSHDYHSRLKSITDALNNINYHLAMIESKKERKNE